MSTRPPGVEENAPAPSFEGANEEPLVAKPQDGSVDIRAMTRQVMADFPKIIAKLAE